MKIPIMSKLRIRVKKFQYDLRKYKEQYSRKKQPEITGSSNPTTTIVESSSSSLDEKKAAPYAIIYKSELDYISRCILDYKNH